MKNQWKKITGFICCWWSNKLWRDVETGEGRRLFIPCGKTPWKVLHFIQECAPSWCRCLYAFEIIPGRNNTFEKFENQRKLREIMILLEEYDSESFIFWLRSIERCNFPLWTDLIGTEKVNCVRGSYKLKEDNFQRHKRRAKAYLKVWGFFFSREFNKIKKKFDAGLQIWFHSVATKIANKIFHQAYQFC